MKEHAHMTVSPSCPTPLDFHLPDVLSLGWIWNDVCVVDLCTGAKPHWRQVEFILGSVTSLDRESTLLYIWTVCSTSGTLNWLAALCYWNINNNKNCKQGLCHLSNSWLCLDYAKGLLCYIWPLMAEIVSNSQCKRGRIILAWAAAGKKHRCSKCSHQLSWEHSLRTTGIFDLK